MPYTADDAKFTEEEAFAFSRLFASKEGLMAVVEQSGAVFRVIYLTPDGSGVVRVGQVRNAADHWGWDPNNDRTEWYWKGPNDV